MNDYKKYWIWLSMTLGAAAKTDEVLTAFPRPHKLYESQEKERILAGVFTKGQSERLRATQLDTATDILAKCEKNGWQVVTPDDAVYPAGLKKISDMPLVLYVDGDISCLRGKVIIGVVGTRKPNYESIAIARNISGDLVKAGAVVVSGGALGIDSAAHEAAMENNGKTVCVLGCGLGTRYLMDNAAMRREISRTGAVVTEYAPFAEVTRMSFPQRNRIISGMSHGLLVVEAGSRSGSLITARCAAEQGREVFAIPGSVLSSAYTGANNLIRDGAKAVTCARDILTPFSAIYPDRINLNATGVETVCVKSVNSERKKPSVPEKKAATELKGDAAAIYGLFGGEALHPDEICAMTGLPLSKVISALMKLEMEDYIEQTEGKNYIIK